MHARFTVAFWTIAVAAVGLGTSSPAAADPPAPTGYVNCTNLGDPANQPFSCSSGVSSASLSISPYALLTGEVHATEGNAQATGFLEYYFEVDGPSSGSTNIPIDVDYHLHQEDTVSYIESVATITAFSQTSGSGDTKTICDTNDNCSDHSNDVSGTLHFTALANLMNTLDMQIMLGGNTSLPDDGTAYVDPLIRIDSSFADAADYSIVLSPGVANAIPSMTAPVPEPETWALLVAGIATIGSLARRKSNGSIKA